MRTALKARRKGQAQTWINESAENVDREKLLLVG
jgi:hypothetical protein